MLHICLLGIMLLLQINMLDVFNKSENIKDNPDVADLQSATIEYIRI